MCLVVFYLGQPVRAEEKLGFQGIFAIVREHIGQWDISRNLGVIKAHDFYGGIFYGGFFEKSPRYGGFFGKNPPIAMGGISYYGPDPPLSVTKQVSNPTRTTSQRTMVFTKLHHN